MMQKTDLRLIILAALLAITLIAWRLFGITSGTALWLQTNLGYWTSLIALAWLGWNLAGVVRRSRSDWPRLWEHHRIAIFIIVLCSVLLHLHEPHMLKVLHDEPSHVAVSYMMHTERVVSAPGAAHWFNEHLNLFGAAPVFRLYLFPTLLSAIHDLIGYRVVNIFVLNGVIGAAVLFLLYGAGVLFCDRRGGLLAVLLFTGFPLFQQVTTSGSYDLLNLAMLLGLLVATARYLRLPAEQGLDLMLSTGVALALCRSESIVYLIVPVIAVVAKWCRERRLSMTPAGAISPLLIWPSLAVNYIIAGNGRLEQASQLREGQSFFALEQLPENARRAVYYLFELDLAASNSVLLSYGGALGLVALWVAVITRWRRGGSVELVTLGGFAALVTAMYAFVLTHFWGMPTQEAATRFILPLAAMFALGAAWLAHDVAKPRGTPRWPVVLAAVFAVTFGVSSSSRSVSTDRLLLPQTFAWFRDYAQEHDRGRTLYVASSPLYMFVYGYPAVSTSSFNAGLENAALCLDANIYDEILIHEVRWEDSITGEIRPVRNTPVSPDGHYEVVAERRFGWNEVSRILRFRPDQAPVKDGEEPKKLKTIFKTDTERLKYLFDLLP